MRAMRARRWARITRWVVPGILVFAVLWTFVASALGLPEGTGRTLGLLIVMCTFYAVGRAAQDRRCCGG